MALKITLLITAILTALISGFFYAYSCSVNPGLARLADDGYVRAMQSINRAVLNPVFFTTFFGTLVMLPVSTWLWHRDNGDQTGFYLLLSASIIYFAGVFLVTAFANVPLNESLEKFSIRDNPGGAHAARLSFEIPWNRFHHIRTWANLVTLALLQWALIRS